MKQDVVLIRICLQREQHQRMSATMLLMLMHSPTNPGFLALIPILIFFSRCRSVAVIVKAENCF